MSKVETAIILIYWHLKPEQDYMPTLQVCPKLNVFGPMLGLSVSVNPVVALCPGPLAPLYILLIVNFSAD